MARGRAVNGSGLQPRQRADGRWEARFQTGVDSGTGKPIIKSIYAKTAEECAKKLRAATAAVDNNTYMEPERMPLREWCIVWLKEYTGSVKPGTVKTYEQNIRLHIVPALGALQLCNIRPHDVQTFINKMDRDGKLSAKSIKNIHGTLHKCLDTAVRIEYIKNNPANRAELPRIIKPEIKAFDSAEIDAFLRASKGTPDEDIYFIALFTGMRLSEILGLQWKRVDFKKGTVKIDQQLLIKRGSDTERTLDTPKNGKARIIKPAQAVMDRLNAIRIRQNEKRLKAGSLWSNEMNLVFTDEIGQPIPHATVEHRFKRLMTSLGMEDHRFHDLRHSYATEGIRMGIPIKTISETLGHYSTAFTMDTYSHVTDEMKDTAADLVQASIERYLVNK